MVADSVISMWDPLNLLAMEYSIGRDSMPLLSIWFCGEWEHLFPSVRPATSRWWFHIDDLNWPLQKSQLRGSLTRWFWGLVRIGGGWTENWSFLSKFRRWEEKMSINLLIFLDLPSTNYHPPDVLSLQFSEFSVLEDIMLRKAELIFLGWTEALVFIYLFTDSCCKHNQVLEILGQKLVLPAQHRLAGIIARVKFLLKSIIIWTKL